MIMNRAGFGGATPHPPLGFCAQGHAKTPDNRYRQRNGGWQCATCHRATARESWRRRRALA